MSHAKDSLMMLSLKSLISLRDILLAQLRSRMLTTTKTSKKNHTMFSHLLKHKKLMQMLRSSLSLKNQKGQKESHTTKTT